MTYCLYEEPYISFPTPGKMGFPQASDAPTHTQSFQFLFEPARSLTIMAAEYALYGIPAYIA